MLKVMRHLIAMSCCFAACASFPRLTKPPLPPPIDAGFFVGEGDVRLYAEVAGPGTRGVVWFVIGPEIASSPVYPRLTAALHEAGFATAVMHPRGTGYSDGLRGDIDDYQRVLGDYRQFFDRLAARFGRRLFLFGHSAGAAFALELSARDTPIAGVVVVNPAYKLRLAKGLGPTFGDYFTYAANAIFRPAALTVDMNSNPSLVENAEDRAAAEEMQRDPLVVRYFSLRYLLAQRKVMDRCPENARATRAPFLLIEGAHDGLVDPAGNTEILGAVPVADKQKRAAAEGGHGSSAVERLVPELVDWLIAR